MKAFSKFLLAFAVVSTLLAGCGDGGSKSVKEGKTDTVTSKESNLKPEEGQKADGAAQSSEGFGESLVGQASDLNATESEFQIIVKLAADVLFDFDKADVKSAAEPELKKLAEIIKTKGKGTTTITGFTDAKGDDNYNRQLSERRALAIANWLKSNGLGGSTFITAGEGEKNPVAPNENADGTDNPEGRAKNRRVEVVINKQNTLGKN